MLFTLFDVTGNSQGFLADYHAQFCFSAKKESDCYEVNSFRCAMPLGSTKLVRSE